MRIDFFSGTIILTGIIALILIFADEYFYGLGVPIAILALALILFALFKDIFNSKGNNK
jgi:hypothetical protein